MFGQLILRWPVEPDSWGQSSSLSIINNKCSNTAAENCRASSHCSGIWKWAEIESPNTAIPRRFVSLQNSASYSRPVAESRPNIPLQFPSTTGSPLAERTPGRIFLRNHHNLFHAMKNHVKLLQYQNDHHQHQQ